MSTHSGRSTVKVYKLYPQFLQGTSPLPIFKTKDLRDTQNPKFKKTMVQIFVAKWSRVDNFWLRVFFFFFLSLVVILQSIIVKSASNQDKQFRILKVEFMYPDSFIFLEIESSPTCRVYINISEACTVCLNIMHHSLGLLLFSLA